MICVYRVRTPADVFLPCKRLKQDSHTGNPKDKEELWYVSEIVMSVKVKWQHDCLVTKP